MVEATSQVRRVRGSKPPRFETWTCVKHGEVGMKADALCPQCEKLRLEAIEKRKELLAKVPGTSWQCCGWMGISRDKPCPNPLCNAVYVGSIAAE